MRADIVENIDCAQTPAGIIRKRKVGEKKTKLLAKQK